MATKNICTYPLLPNMGIRTNAIVEQDGKLHRVNLDHEFANKAKSIFCEAAGEKVLLKDAADARFKNIILCGKSKQKETTGKNLVPNTAVTETRNGVTFTINEDKSITVNGTATNHIYFVVGVYSLEPGDYILSGCTGGSTKTYLMYTQKEDSSGYIHVENDEKVFTVSDTDDRKLLIAIYKDTEVSNLTFYPMISKEGGEYEPYTGGKAAPNPDYPQEIVSVENPDIKVYGKNLIKNNLEKYANVGITYTKNPDGSISVKGTAISHSYYTFDFGNDIPVHGQKLIASLYGCTGGTSLTVGYFKKDGSIVNQIAYAHNSEYAFEYPEEAYSTRTFITVAGGTTVDTVLYPMIRQEDANQEYEMPKEAQVLQFQYEIPGIPVTDGGNYTDKDGQSWISDEIDLERGLYVQRIGKKVLDGSSDEYWYTINATGGVIFAHAISDAAAEGSSKKCFCSHFEASVSDAYNKTADDCYFYDKTFRVCHMSIGTLDAFKTWLNENPITVYYVLETTVETELSDSLEYAFKDVYTHFPNTTIMNDADAYMKLEYVADTKTFIVNSIYESMAALTPIFNIEIELPASGWRLANDNTYFYQIIEIEGTTVKSKIDLQPTSAQLISFINNGTSMFAANENGTIYVYAIGAKPNADITIQATKTEVVYV